MTAARTPRQTPGEGLVPVTVMVAPEERAQLAALAALATRSVSFFCRRVLVDFLLTGRKVDAGGGR